MDGPDAVHTAADLDAATQFGETPPEGTGPATPAATAPATAAPATTAATAAASTNRRRESRARISSVTLELVLERGLDDVTVDEIARAANVSRRTFFNYFPSKVAACIPYTPPAEPEAVTVFLSDRSVPTMTALSHLMWNQVSRARREAPEFDRFHILWRREPGIRAEVHAILARTERQLARLVTLREGLEPGSVEAATVAAASIAILRVAVERWRTDESGALLENLIGESFDAVSDAVTLRPDGA